MGSDSFSVIVKDRKGRDMGTFDFLDSDATVVQLKRFFAKKYPKYYPERQWFTFGEGKQSVALKEDSAALSSYKVTTGSVIFFKDLGPQIGWRTVFLVEYLGPILAHAAVYFGRSLIYPGPIKEYHFVQKLAFWLTVLHYVKRELETVFVHRFSNATMPLLNIFKNSFHYWILSGINIAYFVYHPLYTPPAFSEALIYGLAFLFILGELGNLYCHIILRNLRKPGSKEIGIPRGFLFEYVTCANYTCELFAWLMFAIMTQTLTAYLFLAVSAGQIWLWSVKKHKRLRNVFGDKYPRRKVLVPFLL